MPLRPRARLGPGRGIKPHVARRNTAYGRRLEVLRCVIEQAVSLIQQFRRLKARYDDRDDIHEVLLRLACIVIGWFSGVPFGVLIVLRA